MLIKEAPGWHALLAQSQIARIMGPTWGLSSPGGPHVGPMNLAIRGSYRWGPGRPLPSSCPSSASLRPSRIYDHRDGSVHPWCHCTNSQYLEETKPVFKYINRNLQVECTNYSNTEIMQGLFFFFMFNQHFTVTELSQGLTRTTRMPAFCGNPSRLMITRTIELYWIPSQKKTKTKLQI